MIAIPQERKITEGKSPLELVPPEFEDYLATILAHGVQRYGLNSWRRGLPYSSLVAAIRRHLRAFMKGEDVDDDGLCHLDCIATNALFLSHYLKSDYGRRFDDRQKYWSNAPYVDETEDPESGAAAGG